MTKEELGDSLDTLTNIDNIDYTEVLGEETRQLYANAKFDHGTSILFRIEFSSTDLPEQRQRLFNILKEYNDTEVAY